MRADVASYYIFKKLHVISTPPRMARRAAAQVSIMLEFGIGNG